MVSARRERTANRDVLETCIPPIEAQGFGGEYLLDSTFLGQDTEGFEENFPGFLVRWVVLDRLLYYQGDIHHQTPCASLGGIQVFETTWFTVIYRLALTMAEPSG